MTILGVDYGLQRTGLALFENDTVFELTQLNENDKYRQVKHIVSLANEYSAELVVVGIPPSGNMRKKIEWLQKQLEKENLTVELIDENLTSVQAEHELDQQNLSPSEKKNKSDSRSAKLILQDYLDTITS
ncbi:Holliday junction resolvase RuvX [candidate division WWE3 bacterium]|uniref:Putative pre-16S rRNA nuclease n=1 Tax=candidate division WWE3 bacterium TaxID=2053526 RepID=A0A955LHU6_UNCKA|nr:Holliday junction resolvase RuvX [candidate division WWE3 bacterium]